MQVVALDTGLDLDPPWCDGARVCRDGGALRLGCVRILGRWRAILALRVRARREKEESDHREGDGARSPQNSICAPSSTTRLGGSPKNCVADCAFRDMMTNNFFRHRAIFERPVGMSCSRPRKYEVSAGRSFTPSGAHCGKIDGTLGCCMNP